jgi:hypothetical protein
MVGRFLALGLTIAFMAVTNAKSADAMNITTARKQAVSTFGPTAFVNESLLGDKTVLRMVGVIGQGCASQVNVILASTDPWDMVISRVVNKLANSGGMPTFKAGDRVLMPAGITYLWIDGKYQARDIPANTQFEVTDKLAPGVHHACWGADPWFFKIAR